MITQRLLVEVKTCDTDAVNPGPIVMEKTLDDKISITLNGNGSCFEVEKDDLDAAIAVLFPK